MKAFLLVFDPSKYDRDAVIQAIDGMPAVENWHAFFGNTMVLASQIDSGSLARMLRAACPGLKFIVSEIDAGQRAGWLPKPLWAFLNDPRPAVGQAVDA